MRHLGDGARVGRMLTHPSSSHLPPPSPSSPISTGVHTVLCFMVTVLFFGRYRLPSAQQKQKPKAAFQYAKQCLFYCVCVCCHGKPPRFEQRRNGHFSALTRTTDVVSRESKKKKMKRSLLPSLTDALEAAQTHTHTHVVPPGAAPSPFLRVPSSVLSVDEQQPSRENPTTAPHLRKDVKHIGLSRLLLGFPPPPSPTLYSPSSFLCHSLCRLHTSSLVTPLCITLPSPRLTCPPLTPQPTRINPPSSI
jgi:hypothetical protein